ncbi:uncharacterized protein BHQ10_006058 [Talaromyces amestolkiae]|uniref:LysM domain-containing protein n=1 Tax=Talaromyces amestolkiae TaxID=1196081 RepID=A0A364L2M4_TALAM|nr:uncharacterized protein BHQ10_006058 [Talaromyces amestolkiae]RAO70046.1 hypothetical protein BHQ10_006058 [Talaromyces amestolkiae]
MESKPRIKLMLMAIFAIITNAVTGLSCNSSALNTTEYLYPITVVGTTIFDVAKATNRGACDIARINIMADVEIVPNVGQEILIPPQVCEPDNESCILPWNNETTNECIMGGPRLYYTVNGDTYERIALKRLNITVESLVGDGMSNQSASDPLEPGQYVKIPLCSPSQCVIQPYTFTYGVYKDLAEEYGTTVGQIMMLSPTYNYSSSAYTGAGGPSIDLAINCTALSSNITVIS